jgi:hypothetical protein
MIGAYYFPNFHVDPRNEKVHGKGWTEWEILKRGEPRYAGHHQPKKPLWGMEDESNPEVFQKKIAAAKSAAISYFIFDWYWYEDEPFLHRALESGYMHAANKDQVKFCLMWANHDWENIMPARLREKRSAYLAPKVYDYPGVYDAAAFDRVTDYIVSRYFTEPSYLKIDGAPYFSIYELRHLIERMGGLETARPAMERFRSKVRAAGFPDLHLNAVAWGVNELPDPSRTLLSLGVRSVTSYTWAHHCKMPDFPATEYESVLAQAEHFWQSASDKYGVPYHTDVSMGWDPSPRSCQSDKYEQGDYPFTPTLIGNTPEMFQEALARAKAHMGSSPNAPRILTINSWNEWTEGSYLEPEAKYGMSYLDAIRNVFRRL